MGGAILCILIYHAFCWIYNPIGRFNIGYVGVDVFMFSGFGLYKNVDELRDGMVFLSSMDIVAQKQMSQNGKLHLKEKATNRRNELIKNCILS